MPASAPQLCEFLATIPEKTRQKGYAIFQRAWKGGDPNDDIGENDIALTDEGPRSALFIIPSQSGYNEYEVKLSWTKAKVSARCGCPAFAEYGPCKHVAAAVNCLLDTLGPEGERNAGTGAAEIIAAAKTPIIAPEPPPLSEKIALRINPAQVFRAVDWRIGSYHISQTELRKIVATDFKEAEGEWNFVYRQSAKTDFRQRITYDGADAFHFYCNCAGQHGLCAHLFIAAAQLYTNGGNNYFLQFKDFSNEKAAALAKIGPSI